MTWTQEDIIHRYTRAQAIEDGLLVDVSGIAAEAGIRYRVAVSRRVWEEVVLAPDAALERGQDEIGRLWDVLSVYTFGARKAREREFVYQVLADDGEGPRPVTLKAVCGPGDEGGPAITIMFPEED